MTVLQELVDSYIEIINSGQVFSARTILKEIKEKLAAQHIILLESIKRDIQKSKLPGLNKVIVYAILSKYEVSK